MLHSFLKHLQSLAKIAQVQPPPGSLLGSPQPFPPPRVQSFAQLTAQCEITQLCVITLKTELVSGRVGSFRLQLSHLKHSSWLKIRALQMLFVVGTGPVFLQQLLHKEGMS